MATCFGVVMVKAQFEPLSYMLLNGLSDLAYQCWQEMDSTNSSTYAPDWERYQQMENSNCLRFVSLRDDQKLIGYAAIVVENDMHNQGAIMASFGDIYITPQKRGHAAFFVKYIEKELSGIGVKRILLAEKLNASTPNASGEFYKYLGFQPLEVRWSKTIH